MDKERIDKMALASGLEYKKLDDGTMGLRPYVYAFANAIEAEVYRDIEPDQRKLHHRSGDLEIDDKDVSVGDMFRDIQTGRTIKIVDVAYSLANHKPFAVCADKNIHESFLKMIYLCVLLDTRRWAKMNQYKEKDDG